MVHGGWGFVVCRTVPRILQKSVRAIAPVPCNPRFIFCGSADVGGGGGGRVPKAPSRPRVLSRDGDGVDADRCFATAPKVSGAGELPPLAHGSLRLGRLYGTKSRVTTGDVADVRVVLCIRGG